MEKKKVQQQSRNLTNSTSYSTNFKVSPPSLPQLQIPNPLLLCHIHRLLQGRRQDHRSSGSSFEQAIQARLPGGAHNYLFCSTDAAHDFASFPFDILTKIVALFTSTERWTRRMMLSPCTKERPSSIIWLQGIDGVIADLVLEKQMQCLIYMIKPPKVEEDESLEGYKLCSTVHVSGRKVLGSSHVDESILVRPLLGLILAVGTDHFGYNG